MSQPCPLCGKTKPEEALFCDHCTRKIQAEYEVVIPADNRDDAGINDPVNEEEIAPKAAPGKKDRTPFRGIDPVVEPDESEPDEAELDKKEPDATELNEVDPDEDELNEAEPDETGPRERKRVGTPLFILLLIALLTGAFFVYNATIRKSNLERGGWEAAVKVNSVEGYLSYMEAHPHGAHFDEAQAGLFRLKSEEASAWERMKTTGNATELRDFLNTHPASPYVPLVKSKLDSLVWMGALKVNTADSYSDYIMLSENGGVGGDYVAEARERYALLFRSQPVDAALSDSIRTAIGGFFASLSSLHHEGMFRYLAPTVQRFFNSGSATRERITGGLLVAGAQTEGAALQFIPDMESVQYEIANNHHYKINVPLQKSYLKAGAAVQVHGYIAHVELDENFQIVSIFETKPYPEAP